MIQKKEKAKITDTLDLFMFCIRLSITSSAGYFIARIVMECLSTFLPFLSVWLGSMVVETLVLGAGSEIEQTSFLFALLGYSGALAGTQLVSKGISAWKTYVEGLHQERMNLYTRRQIARKAVALDLRFFDSSGFYDEMQDASGNSPLIVQTTFQMVEVLKGTVQLLVAFLCITGYNMWMGLLLTASILPNILYHNRQLEAVYSFQREHMANERKMYYLQTLMTTRSYAKDVRLFDLFGILDQKFRDAWTLLFTKKRMITRKYTVLLMLTSFLPELVSAVLFVKLGIDVFAGIHTIGEFTYYQGMTGQLLAAMYSLVFSLSLINDGKLRVMNYINFLQWESNVRDTGTRTLQANTFSVAFRDVSFRYDKQSPFVLRHLSFTLAPGKRTALVGTNGSGKSTIVKLLLRFYDPEEGAVFVNGIDIREYTLSSLRSCFSTMFQDYCSYAFTVYESVTLSNPSREREEAAVMEALRRSGAAGFVAQLPHGTETFLTRQYDADGAELSGGQWQKLALARTFYREAAFYILDEPSAALDAESEDELFQQYEALYNGKGALLISHRLSNVANADQILVLDRASLAEQGTHIELMQQNGLYAHMYRLQAEKYERTGEQEV